MYSIGDVVIIITDHPQGTIDTCTKDRLGVITKIELSDDNNQITYSIRDVYDDNFCYEDKEFRFARFEDLRNYICYALKIDPLIATFHTGSNKK